MTDHRRTRARIARLTVALVCLASAIAAAEPETVALLPLDAEARLEVYGQPVAAEIAKTLREGTIDVAVIGSKGTPPPTTKLIVFGSLVSAKGGAVLLQIRTRTPFDGTPLDKVEETASSLATLTTAANKLAVKLLPLVKARLATMRKSDRPPVVVDNKPPPVPARPVVLVGVGVPFGGATLLMEPLRKALTDEVGAWVDKSNRQASPVDASVLGTVLATQTVATAKAERGIAFEILDYEIAEQTTETFSRFPLARARVRVRIADAEKIVFDRVISTDTIVGDRAMRGELLAARVAREVLTILRPHMKRMEKTWR